MRVSYKSMLWIHSLVKEHDKFPLMRCGSGFTRIEIRFSQCDVIYTVQMTGRISYCQMTCEEFDSKIKPDKSDAT